MTAVWRGRWRRRLGRALRRPGCDLGRTLRQRRCRILDSQPQRRRNHPPRRGRRLPCLAGGARVDGLGRGVGFGHFDELLFGFPHRGGGRLGDRSGGRCGLGGGGHLRDVDRRRRDRLGRCRLHGRLRMPCNCRRRDRLLGRGRLGLLGLRGGPRRDGLDEARRPDGGGGRLGRRLGCPGGRLLALRGPPGVREHLRGRGKSHTALAGQALDELARDDLFDRARRALHLDAVIALEQRHHLLAGGVEQFRDFVDPDG